MPAVDNLPDLFKADEVAWLESMAERIAEGNHEDLDYEHLREFLTDMASREKREVKSRLTVLLSHLLKWTHQKRKRTVSWRSTIREQSEELADICESRTLRNHAGDVVGQAYKRAVGRASDETGLPPTSFPKKCPWTVAMLLAEDLLET